ncbi:MAG: hypothetical protein JW839_16210, partial [Candidatus Lokiarchaeota archaeon]|nr:hypothetical protein [Candidatus Lokiarchaeota archaeon]
MRKRDILILVGVSLVLFASFKAMEHPEPTTSSWAYYDDPMKPSASNVAITGMTTVNGTGTYVEGMKFVIRVAFSNTGDTEVHEITATPDYSGYAYLAANSSASIAVPAGGTGSIDFLITVGADATDQNPVTITATWSGTENVTNNSVGGVSTPNDLNVAIQSKADVKITSITCGGASSAGPFVGGMTFAIRVSFKNEGGTMATGVTAAPTYSGYPGLSIAAGNFSSAINIAPNNGTGNIDFLIQVADNATTNASVIVRATWTGTEQFSSRALSGASESQVNLTVGIQQQSQVTITSIIYTTGTGTYVGGMTFVARVNFANTGGTAANGVTAGLSYGGYTSLSSNTSASISIGVGGTGRIDFMVSVATGAPSQNPVTISATWSGTEAISSRSISGSSSGGANLQVAIQSQAVVSITGITYRTGTGTYVGGMTFVVRVAFSNTGGTAANGITAALAYGGYSGLSANTSGSIIISAVGTGSLDFLITVSAGAISQNPVTINATWSGTEAISSRPLSGNSGGNIQNVAIQAQSNVTITGITYRTGSGTYVGGMTFVIRIQFSNTGGTTANNVFIPSKTLGGISFGSFTKYTYNASNSINIVAGGTGFIDILIILDTDAPSASPVTITANYEGTEAISNRALSGNSGAVSLIVAIQSQANVLITSVTYITGSGTYVGGMTFTIRVQVSNLGGTAVNGLTASLTYG